MKADEFVQRIESGEITVIDAEALKDLIRDQAALIFQKRKRAAYTTPEVMQIFAFDPEADRSTFYRFAKKHGLEKSIVPGRWKASSVDKLIKEANR